MVGFSPRMVSYDADSGRARYMRWQHTWWSGLYSIVLTKAAILHKNYLLPRHSQSLTSQTNDKDSFFMSQTTKSVLDYIDYNRNCEDIAMSSLVADLSEAAPVFVRGTVYETSAGAPHSSTHSMISRISSGGSHFADRGRCVDFIRNHSIAKIPSSRGVTHYPVGLQKVLRLHPSDSIRVLYEEK
jgi:Glycosyl transferase family 64 domain